MLTKAPGKKLKSNLHYLSCWNKIQKSGYYTLDMSKNNLITARKAENICSLQLRDQGFTVLGRNRKIFGVEIDILAKRGVLKQPCIFLVEVKYTHSAYNFFSRRQMWRYRYAAMLLQDKLKSKTTVRCLLISVSRGGVIDQQFIF